MKVGTEIQLPHIDLKKERGIHRDLQSHIIPPATPAQLPQSPEVLPTANSAAGTVPRDVAQGGESYCEG